MIGAQESRSPARLSCLDLCPRLQRSNNNLTIFKSSCNEPLCKANSNNKVKAVCRSLSGTSTESIWPWTTDLKNFEVRSTTSSQTEDTVDSSKSEAGGSNLNASKVSSKRSVQRSPSSPLRQARRKKAKAKLKAARDPNLKRYEKWVKKVKLSQKRKNLNQSKWVKNEF